MRKLCFRRSLKSIFIPWLSILLPSQKLPKLLRNYLGHVIWMRVVCGSQYVFDFEIILLFLYATKDNKTQTSQLLPPRDDNLLFYQDLEENIKRIFITNTHHLLLRPHHSNISLSDSTGLLKWTIDCKCISVSVCCHVS